MTYDEYIAQEQQAMDEEQRDDKSSKRWMRSSGMTVASWSISPKGSLFADIKSDNTAQALNL